MEKLMVKRRKHNKVKDEKERERTRIANAKWRNENPEKKQKANKRWRAKNKDYNYEYFVKNHFKEFGELPERLPKVSKISALEQRWVTRIKKEFPNFVFKKIHPPWLMNPLTGRFLEIDLFCEELSLGIEIDGHQHYKWPNAFHKTKEQFFYQLKKDRIRKQWCEKNNITLINIREDEETTFGVKKI